jgi:uncharacterized protein (DUF924 family)
VLEFWFREIDPKSWWAVDPAFDEMLRQRMASLHSQAAFGELYGWRTTPAGRLAEVIVLDQFSRNLFRGQAVAYAFDTAALVLAQEAVARAADCALPSRERNFFYMPYMHSESKLIHVQAEVLFRANDAADNLSFELRHKAIVDRFGRYPHRNAVLGRESTAAELDFLQQPGSSF